MISVEFSKVSELQGDPRLVAFGTVHWLSIFKAVPGINSSAMPVLAVGCRCVVHIRLCRGFAYA